MTARFSVGIDLGTTNSVVAYCDLSAEDARIELLPIPQLVGANTIDARLQLPSFIYLAGDHEKGRGQFDLPWASRNDFAIGEWARANAATVPERTVAGAKSWLCHPKVDRRQPLLPWSPGHAPDASMGGRISPVGASQRYLEHLVAAWNQAFPNAPLAEQRVVLTVPASFDAAAREITREAAIAAGLAEGLLLLEEPQAAIHAWLAKSGDRWRKSLELGDTMLVCDVGGGTSDLTMIGVGEESGELQLRRLAVGDHLLVGGDNMDLALAHFASQLFAQQGLQLDAWQSVSLWHACRNAKESLLQSAGPDSLPVTVLGRGSRLIGGTVTVPLQRKQVEQLLVDGFFPRCQFLDKPQRRRGSGFQEMGLPFESDPAITRHVASFVRAQTQGESMPITHLLFNGGVFKAPVLRQRLMEVVSSWSERDPVRELDAEQDLDYAVARGAAWYGWTREHGGVRIRGGTARSYYIGIETSGLAIPGLARPLRALCVVPRGMEEGTQSSVPSAEIGLVVGEPAQFRFFSSSTRAQDRPGDLLDRWSDDELVETDSMEATLPAADDQEEQYLPVRFESRITELGVLELWCVSVRDDRRWKLEFSVRPDSEA